MTALAERDTRTQAAASSVTMAAALNRALTAFKDPLKWRSLQLAGMKEDHSWDRSAREYVRIYERVLGDRSGAGGWG